MTTFLSTELNVLRSLNCVANCTLATRWYEVQRPSWLKDGTIGLGNDSVNIDFMVSAWPIWDTPARNKTIDFYNEIAALNPESWIEGAFAEIETACLTPALASNVNFQALKLTANCQSTADFFVNVNNFCVTNPDSPEKNHSIEDIDLASPEGLKMIRDAWPFNSSAYTDLELLAWAHAVQPQLRPFISGPQGAAVCQACLPQFCSSAAFSGNPDIAGIGLMISYTTECILITIAAVYRAMSSRYGKMAFLKRFASGAEETGKILISTALFFELFLAVAGLASLKQLNSFYQSIITEHAIIFATFALVTTILLTPKPFEAAKANTILLWIVAIPTVGFVDYTLWNLWSNGPETYGDGRCVVTPNTPGGTKAWAIAIQIIPVSAIVIILWYFVSQSWKEKYGHLPHNVFCRKQHLLSSQQNDQLPQGAEENEGCNLPSVKKTFHVILVMILIVLMWAVIIVIWIIRSGTQELGGSSWAENSFAFGQILVMLVWLPVIIAPIILIGKRLGHLRLNSGSSVTTDIELSDNEPELAAQV